MSGPRRSRKIIVDDELRLAAYRLHTTRMADIRVVAANAVGAALVAIHQGLVSRPAGVGGGRWAHDLVVSAAALVLYAGIAGTLTARLARRLSAATVEWVESYRNPTPRERAIALSFPVRLAFVVFAWWLGGAVVFGLLNGFAFHAPGSYVVQVVMSIILGGLTTCGVVFLMLERLNRPIFVLTLRAGHRPKRTQPGLGTRLILAWLLGSGVPLVILAIAPVGLDEAHRERLVAPSLFLAGVALAVGLAVTVAVTRSITDPLAKLQRGFERLAHGDLDASIPVDDSGEIGLLQVGFNRMARGIQERQIIEDLFGRHVGHEVARAAMARGVAMASETREASMLFIDIVGSTSLAEHRSANEVVAILNDFFEMVVDVTTVEGGWVNKFAGDSALCVFGLPNEDKAHAAAALRAARRMRAGLDRLAQRHFLLDAGIGVSTGPVVAGNVGARERYEYTVIGDAVNEAARLTEAAKRSHVRVLASGWTVAHAADESQWWVFTDNLTLRGRQTPTRAFAPIVEPMPR